MAELKNDCFLRALQGLPVPWTPVWMMRQAGRYLPEYRSSRTRAGSFLDLCKTPELACEVTLQPLERFPLDAAILFSDILTIPDALGLGLYFTEGEGPRFQQPLETEKDILDLPELQVERDLNYVLEAVRLIRSALAGKVPLIGFSGSPWTLACYMLQGGSSRDFRKIKTLMYQQPEVLELLLDKLSVAVSRYLNAQIAAGVQAVQIFDTWGGVLAHTEYQRFSLAFMHKVLAQLDRHHEGRKVPVILFSKGGGLWLEQMAMTGCDALGVDWTVHLGQARKQIAGRCALQGNLDPAVLYAEAPVIRQQVARVLAEYGAGSGHVFNLGHGIEQWVDPDRAKLMIDAVHELSIPYHQE